MITANERRDIQAVGRLLGCDDEYVRHAITTIDLQSARLTPATVTGNGRSFAGKRVCFTGESVCSYQGQPITRELASTLAANAGLEIADSVTKKLDVLVVADARTQSGKARKARQYGTRIIHEPVFWQMLGIDVE